MPLSLAPNSFHVGWSKHHPPVSPPTCQNPEQRVQRNVTSRASQPQSRKQRRALLNDPRATIRTLPPVLGGRGGGGGQPRAARRTLPPVLGGRGGGRGRGGRDLNPWTTPSPSTSSPRRSAPSGTPTSPP